jgi:hypothetical protein
MQAVVTTSLVCTCLVPPSSSRAAAFQQAPDDRASAVRIFTERIERYERLRARLEEPLPPFDERRDGWSLLLTRRYLASAIRAARAHAQPGDIFGLPVDLMFRDVIAGAIYRADIEGLVDDEPEVAVDLTVNEPVPPWALEPVPPALIERLPALPSAIEYRIVGGALVLWDTRAHILIDALPSAFIVD